MNEEISSMHSLNASDDAKLINKHSEWIWERNPAGKQTEKQLQPFLQMLQILHEMRILTFRRNLRNLTSLLDFDRDFEDEYFTNMTKMQAILTNPLKRFCTEEMLQVIEDSKANLHVLRNRSSRRYSETPDSKTSDKDELTDIDETAKEQQVAAGEQEVPIRSTQDSKTELDVLKSHHSKQSSETPDSHTSEMDEQNASKHEAFKEPQEPVEKQGIIHARRLRCTLLSSSYGDRGFDGNILETQTKQSVEIVEPAECTCGSPGKLFGRLFRYLFRRNGRKADEQ